MFWIAIIENVVAKQNTSKFDLFKLIMQLYDIENEFNLNYASLTIILQNMVIKFMVKKCK